MNYRLLILGFLFCSSVLATSPDKADILMDLEEPFSSDICSMAPDGLPFVSSWSRCCIEHDVEYWIGGSIEDKEKADNVLQSCIAKTFTPLIGKLYRWGVDIGGAPSLPTTWRWGYGHSFSKPSWHARSPSEIELIQKKIAELVPGQWTETKKISYLDCVNKQGSELLNIELIEGEPSKGEIVHLKTGKANTPIRAESIVAPAILGKPLQSIVISNRADHQIAFNLQLIKETCPLEKSKHLWPYTGLVGEQPQFCCRYLNSLIEP